ncbi:nuclear DNA helicase II [Cryptococcus deuterogattii R265]|uniref:nuclear DNA helicase II n=1 Tax=Cryptococcus deuterogattii (strain R265) TaxID=294750 RepID=UPI0019381E8C|nr:nuclear DNA helicase II [Cryptococcus deuterogattii R265]
MTRKLKLSASLSALKLLRPASVTLSPLPVSSSSPPPPATLRHACKALALSLPLVLMSGAHQKDYSENNRDLELPSRPATSSTSILPTQSTHTLPPRPNFSLPPRPSTVPCPPRSARPLHSSLRSPSPPRVSWRSRITDTGARISRSRSPSPRRYRSRSPDRYRSSKHTKYRSPSPRYQRRSPSPRARSPFAVRRPSIRRSPSSRPRSRSPPRKELREKSKGSLLTRIGGQHPSKTDHHIAPPATSLKRPLSPTAANEQSRKLSAVSVPIPTGTRTSQIPTGPRTNRIPIGPESLQNQSLNQNRPTKLIPTGPRNSTPAPVPPSISNTKAVAAFENQNNKNTLEEMGNPRKRGGGGKPPPTGRKSLSPPIHDLVYISETYGKGITLKSQWAENPKSPVANFILKGKSGDINGCYSYAEGIVDGKKVHRVTMTPVNGIYGIGDSTNKKEAEKLAALSSLLQLISTGYLEKGKASTGPSEPNNFTKPSTSNHAASQLDPEDTGETATLSDGKTKIDYDRARQFMEYYCHRYRFRKPDVEYTQTTVKDSQNKKKTKMVWEGVIIVGNRRIGMGSGVNKKKAAIQCYLDVAQYLESCDPDLWQDFIEHTKKDKSLNIGLAPHLVFTMSEALIDDVQGTCIDIRHSNLYQNAPPSGSAGNEVQAPPTWHGGAQYIPTEDEIYYKSQALQARLAAYESDPRMARMRRTRASLPVYSRANEMLRTIRDNDVTIIMAATGSGKTTQVPQLLFDEMIKQGLGGGCNIVCTQPRRLAAMSVAERIAEERGQTIGQEVGYQVRFDAQLPEANGSITFCTTGIFLKRMQSALGENANDVAVQRMDQVSHVVVDEVHERDIDTDLLLVVLKRLLQDRKRRGVPIKVVLMSATIDPTLFQSYFTDARGAHAPVAEIPGRTFPVEKSFLDQIVPQLQNIPAQRGGWVFNEKNVKEYLSRELSSNASNFGPGTGIELEIPYPLVALTIAFVLSRSEDGHVLVFLPGWEEIKKVADILLTGRYPLLGMDFRDSRRFSIHYLHSTIPAAEQKEVFRTPPPGVRRIILATNIAETSVTIPDVVYVVDTGRVKEKRYDPERHMSSLVSAWVGSSNLNQRAGRAGRHREGEYYGLVSQRRLNSLEAHQMVEMKRSDLSNVVMHVKALNLGEVQEVLAATIEPPEPSRIVAAMEVLRMLGALDARQNLTSLGRVLLQLPVDANVGKLCLYGAFFRCLDAALTLAAVLTNRDPFLAPPAQKAKADSIKDRFSPKAFRSDPLAIVAAYNQWLPYEESGDFYSATKFCDNNFLSKPTLLQIKQVKQSLLQSLDKAGVIAVSAGGMVDRIGRYGSIPPALNENNDSLPMLAALIATATAPNFAIRTSERTCRTWQDKVVVIHNSSVNSRRREVSGPEESSASFNPAEKRLYAFAEKSRNVPVGGNPNSAPTNLRTVTRLDPMTYMLFGAYELVVTARGLECDGWLPVTGNTHALDDVQRLKAALDVCMLRVFEGLGKSLVMGRDQRWMDGAGGVEVHEGTSRIKEGGGEEENESDDEDYDRPREKSDQASSRYAGPLTVEEINELEMLTTDIVTILNKYADEREGGGVDTVPQTRVNTRPSSPQGRAAQWAADVAAAALYGGGGSAQWGDASGGASFGGGGWGSDLHATRKQGDDGRRFDTWDDGDGWGSHQGGQGDQVDSGWAVPKYRPPQTR